MAQAPSANSAALPSRVVPITNSPAPHLSAAVKNAAYAATNSASHEPAVPESTSPAVTAPGETISEPVPAAPAELDYSEETWVGLNHWAKACGFEPSERVTLPPLEITTTNGYPWQNFKLKARTVVVPLPTFRLRTTNGVLVLQPGTRAAHWDDVELQLGFTPQLVQGEMLVHADDLSDTVEPLVHFPALIHATNRVVVLDPDDDDASESIPRDLRGKNFALDWAQRLAPLLEARGWTVYLTRTNFLLKPLARRAAFADMRQPGLFLNLCFGIKGLDGEQSGLATYCLPPANLPSFESPDGFDDSWHPYPNNLFDAENLEYAFALHHRLNDVPDIVDHGIRRSRFVEILRERNCPAICVSGGSLADPHDAALIATPMFRQKLAEAIADALQ